MLKTTQNIIATALQSPGRCFGIIEVSFALIISSGNVKIHFKNDFTLFTITRVSFILTETGNTVWMEESNNDTITVLEKTTLYILKLAITCEKMSLFLNASTFLEGCQSSGSL